MAGFTNFKVEWETRYCIVDDEPGLFHTWEQYSQPIAASMLNGGAPAGVISRVYGVVEFADGVRRVYPERIQFTDDIHADLCDYKMFLEEREKKR